MLVTPFPAQKIIAKLNPNTIPVFGTWPGSASFLIRRYQEIFALACPYMTQLRGLGVAGCFSDLRLLPAFLGKAPHPETIEVYADHAPKLRPNLITGLIFAEWDLGKHLCAFARAMEKATMGFKVSLSGKKYDLEHMRGFLVDEEGRLMYEVYDMRMAHEFEVTALIFGYRITWLQDRKQGGELYLAGYPLYRHVDHKLASVKYALSGIPCKNMRMG